MYQKNTRSSQNVTLLTSPKKSSLHLASFVPHGLPRFRVRLTVGLRHFIKDYSLPLIITAAVLLLLSISWIARISERATLAGLLLGAPTSGQDYGTLLSRDRTAAPARNDADDTDTGQNGPTNSTAQLTVNRNNAAAPPANSPPLPGGGAPAPAPFTASIAGFQQNNVTLECTSPKPNKGSCSKKYAFSAHIFAQNGPGTVTYSWRSNLAASNEDGGFSVGGGSSSTTLQKQILIACNSAGSYTLQIFLTSPNQAQSQLVTFEHNCNEI